MVFLRIVLYILVALAIFFRGFIQETKDEVSPLASIFLYVLFGIFFFFTFGTYGLIGKLIAIFYTIWVTIKDFLDEDDIKGSISLGIIDRFMRFIFAGVVASLFFTDIGLIAR